MIISVICPLYNGESYIENLNKMLLMQENIENIEIRYILTNTKDGTKDKLDNLNCIYSIIEPDDFSHSLTREKEVYKCNGDIVVFITQDVIIKDRKWLYKLTKDINDGVCEASFSRQICTNKTIERYTRMKNYPKESRVVAKKDIETLGIMTFFYSDAASAIKKDVFIELNGYDKKRLLTNEDMYIAYKIIDKGYRIKYCADAEVIHSHEYDFKSLFKRYFDQGVFLKQHSYISEAGAGDSALSLLKFVAINSLRERNMKAFIDIIPNFGVRFIANKLGQRYDKLSKKRILKYTSNRSYWINDYKN